MSKFSDALAGGKFVITVEVDPPRGTALGELDTLVGGLSSKVDAVVISDNRSAVARMSPVLAAHHLIKHAQAEVILTLTCRDRNRLALTSEMLAAAAGGVENLLLVSGDFVTLGDQPGSRPVYDLDSVQALILASLLAQGRDFAGEISEAASFFAGASLPKATEPPGLAGIKFSKKLKAGAGYFMTQPVESAAEIEALANLPMAAETKIIAGLELGAEEEAGPLLDLAQELKSGGKAAGVHLACPEAPQRLTELVDKLS
ncbi:MAG: methylenetetrahydrofolate reductase [Deltaproteobacteria bacterium]|nr:methylenetetrahydrofolate reductase [Deltaproteobacteria bacterium]